MKDHKRPLAIMLALALVLGLCGGALAAAVTTPVEGVRDPRVTVTIDGRNIDLGGVEPVIIDGSTYLPLRAISELLGLGVDWDRNTRQVQLSTNGAGKTVDGTPIQPTTAVNSLEALVGANLNQYFEVGGLRVVKLQEGIFHIDEGTTANPNGPTNNGSSIYLVIGDDTAAMIDGGNGQRANANFKDADMAEIVQALVGDREMKVIITHSHGDHTGLFQDEDSYSVVPKDVPLYICEDDLDTLAASVKEKYTVNTLKDGETIEAGGRTLHVVTMPAHTDGSLALIDYENEVIFTGDTIGSGTVWLFSENNVAQYDGSVRKLAALVEDMDDPVIYAGHRWQQGDPVVSAAGIAVQEMGKYYVLETVELLDDIKTGKYQLAESYAPSSDPGNDYPMYSTASDRNQDGIIPGIYALPVAVEGFIPGTTKAGVTVTADAASPTGYTATFVYAPAGDKELASVQVTGTFQLIDPEDVTHMVGPEDYENGMYYANVNPNPNATNGVFGEDGVLSVGYTRDMTLNEATGNWETSFPLASGASLYSYILTYADGSSETIDDPANPSLCRENEANSNSVAGDLNHSVVYGIWDPEKQSKSPDLSFMNDYEGAERGSYEYVEYAGAVAEDQDLGIYLPPNYDASREEPYRVIYITHGAGGNETDWIALGHMDNVMDHLIAEDPDNEAIIVSMDNSLMSWDYPVIADNVLNYIIPYMEENYNVSTDAQDRAFCGFSMGSMTTTYIYFHHADQFGYYGIFSGTNTSNFDENGANLDQPVVYTSAGTRDTASQVSTNGNWSDSMAYETIRDWCAENIPQNHVDGGYKCGSHDWYTWSQHLYEFAGDVCWSRG